MIAVGVIGYGYWGPNLVRNFGEVPGGRVDFVTDLHPERLSQVAARYPATKVSTDYRDLINDPSVDAVAIATPVSSHFDLAMAALRAGKHVWVEKPMTSTSEQSMTLIDEAQKRGLVLMVDHTFVYTNAVAKMRELTQSGDLGEIYYYDSVRINLGLFQHDVNVLWDLAVHDLSIMDYVLAQTPVAVSATGLAHVPGQPENIAYMTMFFGGRLIAHVHVNWLAPGKVRRTLLGGSRRLIGFDDLEASEKIKVYDRGISGNPSRENGYQMLFGEWPTRDWIDPGLPLMFGASALAQRIFGSTLFAEAMLVSIAFGLAAAFTVAAVRQLTGSTTLAILAALFEIAVFPRTYSYPKIVAYAFEFWLYGRYVAQPDRTRLCAMAAGVAIAFLFRHDHGLFLGAGAVLTILLAREGAAWKTSLREVAIFTACLVALLLPYLIYVQAYGGLWLYFRNGVEFSQREALRQWHVWPRVVGDERPLESAFVYELYVLPIIALGMLLATRARETWRAVAARIAPVAVVALFVDFSFIRDPLNTRLADAIVPAVLLGAWLLWRAFSASRRALAVPVAVLFMTVMGA